MASTPLPTSGATHGIVIPTPATIAAQETLEKKQEKVAGSLPDMTSHNGLRGIAALWVAIHHSLDQSYVHFNFQVMKQ